MKHISTHLLVALLIATSLVACEKMLDIDDDPTAHQLVLNAIPTPDSRAFVNFSYTHFYLDNNNIQPVDGAQLTLTVNNTPLAPDSISHCNYFFPHILQPDDQLAIDIATPRGNVHAETYIPRYPDIQHLTITDFQSPSFAFYLAQFQLNDHPDYPEYYTLTVIQRDSGQHYNTWTRTIDTIDTTHSTYFILNNNPEITSNQVNPYIPLGGYLYSQTMFLDQLIDGQQYPIDLYIMRLVDTNEIPPFKHTYTLRLQSVTPARWNYILSNASANSMTSIFAEPSQPYSNVVGALGIFAGSATTEITFDPDTLPPAPRQPHIPLPALPLPQH